MNEFKPGDRVYMESYGDGTVLVPDAPLWVKVVFDDDVEPYRYVNFWGITPIAEQKDQP